MTHESLAQSLPPQGGRRVLVLLLAFGLACTLSLLSGRACADEPASSWPPQGGRPFESVVGDIVASSYQETAFDWRSSPAAITLEWGQPLELNNFESSRVGLLVMFPQPAFLAGLDLAYVRTVSTASSLLLEETPVRQLGRPSRIEYGLAFDLPLAEGMANSVLSVLPAAHMVWAFQARLRTCYYPGMYRGAPVGDVLKSAFLGADLNNRERDNLRASREPGMQISTSRRELLLGLKGMIFHQVGVFFAPSLLLALPSLDRDQSLGWWWEMSLGVGYAI